MVNKMKKTKATWEKIATKILKDEIRRNLESYETLGKKIGMNTASLTNKINRGTFGAAFFLEALAQLGVKQINVPNICNYKQK